MTGLREISVFLLMLAATGLATPRPAAQSSSPQNQSAGTNAETKIENGLPPALPNGKKLILKDGNYHLVRSYEHNGDRVRYFSLERSEWEEIPSALVDWEATAKAESDQNAAAAALVEKAHRQEIAARAAAVLDIDASLQVSPGVFLPPGEGMFIVEDGHVFQLEQAGSEVKTDKKRFLEQVLSPIPIVPSKQNVLLEGTKAKFRVSAKNVEFYLREAPPDPDRAAPIQKSSRPGDSGPEIELVRAVIKGNRRQLESIQNLFGREKIPDRKTFPVQRWEIAPTVFRFTLGSTLQPGEYALAEILPDGMNLFVWDFGVDEAGGASVKK